MKITIQKPIRQLDDKTFWVGVRDKYILGAIENKEMLEIELPEGIALVNPKHIKKHYKPEPFVGLFPSNPMMFYYFPAKLLSKEEKERYENRSLIYSMG